MEIAFIIFMVFFVPWVAAKMAQSRGRSQWGWFFATFFIGAFSIIALLLIGKAPDAST